MDFRLSRPPSPCTSLCSASSSPPSRYVLVYFIVSLTLLHARENFPDLFTNSLSMRIQIKSAAAYSMLMMIVGGVGLACVKEGKGVEINMMAFGVYANVCGDMSGVVSLVQRRGALALNLF